MRATVDLVRKLGAEVSACLFVVELAFLGGRKLLKDVKVESLVIYDE
jgi:Adenine/guanine phosphoribosyltransferases and related PRPP-binding proteins